MTESNSPAVYAIDPPQAARAAIESACAREKWEMVILRSISASAGSGRKLCLLARCDAADLYVALHRRQVAVISFSKISVRSTPEGPLRDDRVISLPKFCEHKAYTTSNPDNHETWPAEFSQWTRTVACDDHRDPRCLPFHIFQSRSESSLYTTEERNGFNKLHRLPATNRPVRLDKRGVVWDPARPGARHGREPITVAGTRLVDGFHWDVRRQRSGRWRLATSDVTWDVAKYINVYPDGATRFGDRCTPMWSRGDSAREDHKERRKQARKS